MPPATLLVADGNLTIRRVIEVTFGDAGLRVVSVDNGRDAIARLEGEPPDIVLADVGMAQGDGYEVAAFIKKTAALAHIPVLLLAGALEPIDQARAREVGADGFLVKPFEPHVAVSRVRELLERRPDRGEAAAVAGAPPAGGDYLDRLDAAFAAMGAAPLPTGRPAADLDETSFDRPAPPPSLHQVPAQGSLPTGGRGDADLDETALDRPAAAPPPLRRVPAQAAVSPGGRGDVEPDKPAIDRPVPLPPAQPAVSPVGRGASLSLSDAFVALLAAEQGRALPDGPGLPTPALADGQIDEIARRVAARLGDEPLRQAVLDAAERLVGQEIDRIKRVQRG